MRVVDGRVVVMMWMGWSAGCDAFLSDERCTLGEKSCSGRDVRACVVDIGSAGTDPQKNGRWSTERVCEDDPLLGPSVCGVVEGKPACVSRPADAGLTEAVPSVMGEMAPAQWL